MFVDFYHAISACTLLRCLFSTSKGLRFRGLCLRDTRVSQAVSSCNYLYIQRFTTRDDDNIISKVTVNASRLKVIIMMTRKRVLCSFRDSVYLTFCRSIPQNSET